MARHMHVAGAHVSGFEELEKVYRLVCAGFGDMMKGCLAAEIGFNVFLLGLGR
jgi:hypothetical protein